MKLRPTDFAKGMCLPFIFLFVLLISDSANAETNLFTLDKDTSISMSGELTLRNTYENWFEPALNTIPSGHCETERSFDDSLRSAQRQFA
jgi:hypothetical protein